MSKPIIVRIDPKEPELYLFEIEELQEMEVTTPIILVVYFVAALTLAAVMVAVMFLIGE